MTTARAMFHLCRRAGIVLAAHAEGIIFDAPAGAAVPVDELAAVKPELLAMLAGHYFTAARELLRRVDDEARRLDLAEAFDERAAIVELDGGMSRGEAQRRAYIELAKAVEADSGIHQPPEPLRSFGNRPSVSPAAQRKVG